jgi:hypothetical protein
VIAGRYEVSVSGDHKRVFIDFNKTKSGDMHMKGDLLGLHPSVQIEPASNTKSKSRAVPTREGSSIACLIAAKKSFRGSTCSSIFAVLAA